MVEEECRRYRPTKNYLEHLPALSTTAFETDLLKNDYERLQNHLPMESMSMKRYELPPPPNNKLSEISAWGESVDNSMAQLEHQSLRSLNLELMIEYGCESWKAYLEIITSMLAKAQERLQELKKEIQDVNWQRKKKQTDGGEKLKGLEEKWVTLVSKNYEIEQACVKMEEFIAARKAEQLQWEAERKEQQEEDNEAEEADEPNQDEVSQDQEEGDQDDDSQEQQEAGQDEASSSSPSEQNSNSNSNSRGVDDGEEESME
jgi:pre-mRNA-splicing factor SPF27